MGLSSAAVAPRALTPAAAVASASTEEEERAPVRPPPTCLLPPRAAPRCGAACPTPPLPTLPADAVRNRPAGPPAAAVGIAAVALPLPVRSETPTTTRIGCTTPPLATCCASSVVVAEAALSTAVGSTVAGGALRSQLLV